MILKADKEGGFVVLPNSIFGIKACEAFNKNFKPIRNSEARVKKGVVRMCKSFNLDRLARDISSTSGTALSVFFTAKTHKPGISFRTILSERGTWQAQISHFI